MHVREVFENRVLKAAKELVDSVDFDNNGILLPNAFQGGNGGLLSIKTIQTSDALRKAIGAYERLSQSGENSVTT